ncbi:glycosyltransferase [Micromonospora craniellae]|uniref:Glycosyltransferase n=2 Tax=Micromonospora craniellae TaxID=2294034 RepID=A0A372G261_9ACTN|nr:glycosyltransferase [Micromonospora craniellae]QOC94832.1 glycosyltransferase [Micromonospora craniellae]RFS46974.1 glycosyltransferase [Micromonospora craniellae]
MLVDNAVNGDSRVQKIARSAAEAGWTVTLLGRSPDKEEHTWQLGQAEVRLLPVSNTLSTRPHQLRRNWLRAPLGYPPNGAAALRSQQVKAWRADLRVRRIELDMQASAGKPVGVRRQMLRAESFAVRAVGRWVRFRRGQSHRARDARQRLDGPWDRLYTRFWQSATGDRSWRRLEPALWDWELSFGKVVDRLKPDLIHAHDFRMIGVGARAVLRARSAGRTVKLVWDAHEFLPGIRPRRDDERWMPAHCAHEREYAPYADAVLTVSSGLAEWLQERHGLAKLPDVVLNAPGKLDSFVDLDESTPNLRTLCGIDDVTPLLVYSGAAAEQRGMATMVEALPHLGDAHAAFVVNSPSGRYVQGLVARAEELGVADRMHVLPYVAHHQVVSFLSAATLGVIPIHHWPNHEIALITKFFEYSHARLPMVVSDVKTMAAMVRETGQGEVFTAEDVTDFIRAVRAVLADPERYRAVYDRPGLLEGWTWEAQAQVLEQVYSRLLPDRPAPPRAADPDVETTSLSIGMAR